MMIKKIEELRHALTRQEQEAAFREERLKRDYDDLQKLYKSSELRYSELVTQVTDITRPLLRQTEAMQITISRTEQTQLNLSLEKERQRASESSQEYLSIKEELAMQEGRAKQLEEEIKELRASHKKELQAAAEHGELLEKELEREKAARAGLEKTSSHDGPKVPLPDQTNSCLLFEGNAPVTKLWSAGNISSLEKKPGSLARCSRHSEHVPRAAPGFCAHMLLPSQVRRGRRPFDDEGMPRRRRRPNVKFSGSWVSR